MISDLARFEDGRSVHLQSLEAQQLQLELAFREAVAVEAIQGGHDVSRAVDLVSEALSIVRCEMEHRESERGHQAPLYATHTRGRPKFDIPLNQLAYLLECRFTVPK